MQNVGFDQRLNEQVPLDLSVYSTIKASRQVKLGEYFGQKPVVLVLAYYRCPMLCTQVLNGLVQGLRETPFTAGKEFDVVTVSFDPNETTDMAAAKKRNYVHSYGKPESAHGWHFLTGDLQSISRLTHAVGFRYAYDAQSDQFAHAAGIVVLTPTGKVSRYFYDVHYSGRDLRLGLVEASHNQIGSPIDQVLLFCFHYDPTAGKYGANIMNFVRYGGVLTVVGLVLMIGLLLAASALRPAGGDVQSRPSGGNHLARRQSPLQSQRFVRRTQWGFWDKRQFFPHRRRPPRPRSMRCSSFCSSSAVRSGCSSPSY